MCIEFGGKTHRMKPFQVTSSQSTLIVNSCGDMPKRQTEMQ